MKIQCSCGAKYAFDITPEMLQNPVRFVCPACGLDSSEYVNQLAREELAEQGHTIAPPPPPQPAAAPRLRISHEEKPAEPVAEAESVSKFCQKHRGELTTEYCTICQKPICPKCMELFGYFCSPLCINKADLQGIEAPVYAGQKFQVEGRFWRKAGLIFGSVTALLALFIGGWIWYAWFGAVPHPYFSVRFADDNRGYSGQSRLVGKDQLVFLHGGTLARYDLKTKKPVWSLELISKQQIDDAIKAENEATERANAGGGYSFRQSASSIERQVKIGLQQELQLRISGQNVWVSKPYTWTNTQMTHYDWNTGKIVQQVLIPNDRGQMIAREDELLLLKHTEVGAQFVTHVDLANGEMRTEEFHEPGIPAHLSSGKGLVASGGGPGGRGAGKLTDAEKLAQQAQNATLPARIALPATLSATIHEQQLEAELNDNGSKRPNGPKPRVVERFSLIPSKYGYLQLAVRLIEAKTISHVAMKAPPKKSALDGEVNASKTGEIANELLNEMQRNAGGDTVEEDASRYQVTIRRPDSPDIADWTGEVTGSVDLYPLKNVNVLTAGKTVIVFDKSNKKLWEATLTYPVSGGAGALDDGETQFGAGPCVEHGDTLYVFDEAVLSAFDLKTGSARWRLPSVGVVGLFFDDKDFVYVNTTSGNPDDIKYSRQIDITKATDEILMKVDPKTGKTLWSVKPGGFISYLSGKFIYTVQANDPNPMDEEQASDMALTKPPYFRVARISQKNGKIMWEHFQDRVPFDIRFQDNSIELVFKREVQVLKFLAF